MVVGGCPWDWVTWDLRNRLFTLFMVFVQFYGKADIEHALRWVLLGQCKITDSDVYTKIGMV